MTTKKRRRQGVPGLYKRGKSWRYDFLVKGRRFTGTLGQVSKTVAQEQCEKVRVMARAGQLNPRREKPSPVFVTEKLLEALSSKLVDDGSFAHSFLVWSEANCRSYKRDRVSVKALGKTLAGRRLEEITPWLIEKHRYQRQRDGVTDATINRELSCLRRMFNKAIAWRQAKTNPMQKVKLAKEDNGRVRYLTPEEEGALIAALSPELRDLVITAIHTGLRAGELMTLTPENVDLEAEVITVEAAYSKNGERRCVPMNETTKTVLSRLVEDRARGERLFRNSRGKPYTRHGYTKAFRTALQRAGIENFRFHDLRHCFGSFLAMGGAHPLAIQRVMGHKSSKMTARYTHLAESFLRDTVRLLDRRKPGSDSRQFSHHLGETGIQTCRGGIANAEIIQQVS